jgi:hypothetical protein
MKNVIKQLEKLDSSLQDINKALRHNLPDGDGVREVRLSSDEHRWVIGGLKPLLTSKGTTPAAQRGIRKLLARLESDGAMWSNDQDHL